MNTYTEALLNTLSDKYPGYLFEFDEYPSMLIVYIKNRSTEFVFKKGMPKYKDVSLIIHAIEGMMIIMREEELKSVVGWSDKNIIGNRNNAGRYNNFLDIKPMSINKYSIAPKEIIFQDEKTTIINWNDRTKTIVKCSDDDVFSPEAGIALCYMKKFITDNDSERFHRILKSLISVSKFKNSKQEEKVLDGLKTLNEALSKVHTTEENHDVDTGTPDNSGNNDFDGSAMEVES